MTYSRTKVDRAGRFLANEVRAAGQGKRRVADHRAETEEALLIIDWWRSQHVKPLSAVAANLFRYVAQHGDPIVAQLYAMLDGSIELDTSRMSEIEDLLGQADTFTTELLNES